ncbi:dienelactone hydrolase family protein [Desulfosporosinus sp. OT]|uniref:dienelactone hydrolase family protein n=1 Tax=Desulfosporosinus sp. OT TaxID=913865 RepID=UPI0002239F75|nr:dienelactone hydrolase family protein [Desulfosporosinus sp. OT]EGW40766.1 dienelactone hydrolase family protein [Desulfosporosinus sp. OT]
MLTIKNDSDTVIIVLHEIYGINQYIKITCDHFSMNGYDVVCPDLINTSQPFSYNQEKVAYLHFMENIGFESAYQKVKKFILQTRTQYKSVFLVGFSIGATIAWLCSNENNICDGVIGYYGSRIRDYIGVTPKCPVLLLFSHEEKSLNVKELINSLQEKNIGIHVLSGKHGFSDPFNKNYCEQSCKDAERLAYTFLEKVRKNIKWS